MADAIITPDGGIVVGDRGTYVKFDKFGKYVSKVPLNSQMINSRIDVDVVSVITSSGGTDIYIDKDGNVTRKGGSLSTVMDLSSNGGYLRRLRLSFCEGGINCTQTIFVYNKGVELCI